MSTLAHALMDLGRLGRHMPPAWDGARCTSLACGPDGQYFGKVLPGRGLYLAHDLKALGITRPLPYVYERSPLMRAVEAMDTWGTLRGHLFDAERAAVKWLDLLRVGVGRLIPACAITSYDGIITARAGGKGQDVTFSKVSVTGVANNWTSLWKAGGFPAAGGFTNIPGGAAPTRASTGALSVGLTNPTPPDKTYLLTLGLSSGSTINMFILADQLVAAGNIVATSAAAQTVNSTALTRYTTGAGVLMTFEITTGMSATAHTITANKYTNQSGTTLQSTGAQTGINAGIVGRTAPTDLGPYSQLASGDYGVQSVQEVTIGTALAAGVYALILYYPLAFMPGLASAVYVERDSTTQIDGLTELVQTSGNVLGALMLFVQPNSTGTSVVGFLRTAVG